MTAQLERRKKEERDACFVEKRRKQGDRLDNKRLTPLRNCKKSPVGDLKAKKKGMKRAAPRHVVGGRLAEDTEKDSRTRPRGGRPLGQAKEHVRETRNFIKKSQKQRWKNSSVVLSRGGSDGAKTTERPQQKEKSGARRGVQLGESRTNSARKRKQSSRSHSVPGAFTKLFVGGGEKGENGTKTEEGEGNEIKGVGVKHEVVRGWSAGPDVAFVWWLEDQGPGKREIARPGSVK